MKNNFKIGIHFSFAENPNLKTVFSPHAGQLRMTYGVHFLHWESPPGVQAAQTDSANSASSYPSFCQEIKYTLGVLPSPPDKRFSSNPTQPSVTNIWTLPFVSYHYKDLKPTISVLYYLYYKNKVGMFNTHLKIRKAFQTSKYNTPFLPTSFPPLCNHSGAVRKAIKDKHVSWLRGDQL